MERQDACMVNEERIKLMTRMAAYEKDGHKKNKAIVSFFKSDYISMQMIKSMIASTLAFAIVFGLYVLYDFELFMKEINAAVKEENDRNKQEMDKAGIDKAQKMSNPNVIAKMQKAATPKIPSMNINMGKFG